jgi:hypothetical protein
MASVSQTTFGNGNDPLVASGLSGGRIQSAALLPGLGGAVVHAPWYTSAIVFWGLAVQDYEFYGAVQQGKTRPAAAGNLRGSLGYSSDEWYGGILGYKSIMTIDSPDLLLTTTSSLVEIHVGRRF